MCANMHIKVPVISPVPPKIMTIRGQFYARTVFVFDYLWEIKASKKLRSIFDLYIFLFTVFFHRILITGTRIASTWISSTERVR